MLAVKMSFITAEEKNNVHFISIETRKHIHSQWEKNLHMLLHVQIYQYVLW